MFSKSLFKQSCKASGTMWTIITAAVCFMLACVMLIAGNGDLAETKNAIQNTIIEGEMTSEIEKRSINYYCTSTDALQHFDETFMSDATTKMGEDEYQAIFAQALQNAILAGKPAEEAMKIAMDATKQAIAPKAYEAAVLDLQKYALDVARERGLDPENPLDKVAIEEIKGSIFIVLNPMIGLDETTGEPIYMFDKEFYEKLPVQVENPRYDMEALNDAFAILTDTTMTQEEQKAALDKLAEARATYRSEYAAANSIIFVSGNMIKEENIEMILDVLSKFGVTMEQYNEFGFNNYEKIQGLATSALIDFRANYEYRITHMKPGETAISIAEELTKNITQSLLASLPHEVSDALEEIGQADLYGILVGSIFFKMAGLLLPIIYLIMTANSLIAGQVDSGSMAYILSTSTKRKTVTCTQALFLVGSLFAMFSCTTVTSLICLAIVHVDTQLTYAKLLLMNLGAFLVMFAMSGICFLTSCWFNRSKRSMGIGGGLNMFFLVATMLGLFGSSVLPSIIRMDALNIFNYVSIISLFDVISILDGTLAFLWKLGILVVIGVICYIIGSEKFKAKDLPL